MAKPIPADTGGPPQAAHQRESRAAGFMRSALAILGETGRADFTVAEVVERSKTSLRAFYQHYATKDDLLLALIGKIMAESTQRWYAETADMTGRAALRRLLERVGAPPNRARRTASTAA